jgi:hypothetical protein
VSNAGFWSAACRGGLPLLSGELARRLAPQVGVARAAGKLEMRPSPLGLIITHIFGWTPGVDLIQ